MTGPLQLNSTLKIGATGIVVSYDAQHNAIRFDGNIYATGWLSGYGLSDSTAGEGGVGLDEEQLAEYLTTNHYLTANLASGYFASKTHNHPFSEITNRPTTLVGYGITDALSTSNYRSFLDNKYVTLDTAQTITGIKTFTNGLYIGGAYLSWDGKALKVDKPVYSTGQLSGYGLSDSTEETGGSVDLLTSWGIYTTDIADSYALSAGLGYGLRSDLLALTSRVTTLEGKNYLDAFNLVQSGSGNAVTALSLSSDKKTLTVTKGSTFLTEANLDHIISKDTRNAATSPNTYMPCIRANFKINTTNGLADGGTYNGELHFRPYGTNLNDMTGGYPHQLGFTANGNIWHRIGTSTTTWGAWHKLLSDANYASVLDGKYVTLDTAQTISGAKTFTANPIVSTRAMVTTTGIAQTQPAATTTIYSDGIGIRGAGNDGGWIRFNEATTNAGWLEIATGDDHTEPIYARQYSTAGAVVNAITLMDANGNQTFNTVTATALKKSGGTSSQFLMADGSVKALTDITSAYVTALGTSGNYLTWTKNGTVNNITVPYAENAINLFVSNASDLNGPLRRNGIYSFAGASNAPGTYGAMLQWSNVAEPTSGTAQHWITQLGSVTDGGGLWVRTRTNATAWRAWERILTSTNFNTLIGSNLTAYVKKSGDTMTGALMTTATSPAASTPFAISNGRIQSYGNIYLNANSDNGGQDEYILLTAKKGLSSSKADGLVVGPSTLTWQNKTVWHAGNDGAGSGLDADLLDGLHLTDIRGVGYAMQDTWIDASSLDVDTWYPVTMNIGAGNNVRIEVLVSLDSGTKPSWSTHNGGFSVRVIWEVNGSGWGTNPINRTIYASDYAFTSTSPVRGMGQMNNSSNEYVYVRGGGKYRFRTSNGATPVLRTSTYTALSQSVSPTTTPPAEIKRDNARTSDNVASATKLATARTIWGQSFDGTGNVTGNMTNITTATSSQYFDRDTYGGSSWHMGYGAYNTAIANNDSQTPLMVAYRAGQSPSVTGANRLFSLELLNTGTDLWFNFGGANKFKMTSRGQFEAASIKLGSITLKAENGCLHVSGGGMYADGQVSGYGLSNSTEGSSVSGNYVDLTSEQTITGQKVFTALAIRSDGAFLCAGGAAFYGEVGVGGQISSTVANGTAPLLITSKTLCGNLNADLLDGVHASGLFTALSVSGTTLSVTVGGTTKTATLPSGGTTGSYLPLTGGTLTGDLRLKDTSNYGRSLLFGDGNYCYLKEDTDDHLTIYASKGINLNVGSGYNVTINGVALSTGGSVDLSAYMPKSGGTFTGEVITRSVRPSLGASYDLGSESYKYNRIFLSGTAFFGARTANSGQGNRAGVSLLGGGAVVVGGESARIDFIKSDVASTSTLLHQRLILTSASQLELHGSNYSTSTGKLIANVTAPSDATLKTVTSDLSLTAEQIAHAPAVNFIWKDSGVADVGSIAQYWRTYLPYAVGKTGAGTLTLDYGRAALLSAIVTARRVLTAESRMQTAEERIAALQAEVETLRGLIGNAA